MDRTQLLLGLSIALFSLGLLGVIVRRNVLVMLMCMELMLNGVIVSLVTFAQQSATTVGAVLVFLIFTAALQSATEIADKLPIYQARLWTAFYELDEVAARFGLDSLSTAGITRQLQALPIAGTISSFVGSVVTFVGNFYFFRSTDVKQVS